MLTNFFFWGGGEGACWITVMTYQHTPNKNKNKKSVKLNVWAGSKDVTCSVQEREDERFVCLLVS